MTVADVVSGRVDATHDPTLTSWVSDANGHTDFPIQNLPLAVASIDGGEPQGVVAIGDHVLVLSSLLAAELIDAPDASAISLAARGSLNDFLAAGAGARCRLRTTVSKLLSTGSSCEARAEAVLRKQSDCAFQVPLNIGDYSDFYAGIHHARSAGALFRPEAPLLPNYHYVPIGYHGRASSVRVSGHPVPRPVGQTRPDPMSDPSYQPSTALDYELELGLWVGKASGLGEPVPIAAAGQHLAGISLLNDWSARDIQRWEYQPLGPFLAKSFLTTVSPWVVTVEALAPFRSAQTARPVGAPRPMPYLFDETDQMAGALDICLDVHLETRRMRQNRISPVRVSRASALDLYWTPAQLIAHHSSNGCNLSVGDLFGTGTISAEHETGGGCLLERTRNGRFPLRLPTGETRTYLEKGDRVTFTGRCKRAGHVTIGFGELSGEVVG